MSNSVRPHRWQPTRLPHPWDSPGKNTGVGCHFFLQCMKVKNKSEATQSCPTLHDPMDCSLSGSSVHGIFQARILEWGAIAFFIDIYIYTSIFTSQTIYIDIHEFPLYFSFQSTLFFYFFVYVSPFSNMRNLMFLIHLFSIYLLHQSYLYVAHFSLYLCSPLIGLSWTPVILSST